ncbi:hypothetical protein ABIC17_003172 [Sphingomonas sp. PvP056]|jgi:hypothetical protein
MASHDANPEQIDPPQLRLSTARASWVDGDGTYAIQCDV